METRIHTIKICSACKQEVNATEKAEFEDAHTYKPTFHWLVEKEMR